MKKKIKIAAGFLTVIFCILLGCERREKEADTLFLEEIDSGGKSECTSALQQQAEAEEITSEITEAENEPENDKTQTPAEPQSCVVHICGAVNAPGVYTLEEGDRIYQAIEIAGGFREDAEQDYLNQADLLSDGMKIYVPTQEEVLEADSDTGWVTFSGESSKGEGLSGNRKDTTGGNASLININTAGEEQLCTLPGVGSSKAKSIIAYREQNGAYQRIEDIMNVEGIKDGVFQKIKDSITI